MVGGSSLSVRISWVLLTVSVVFVPDTVMASTPSTSVSSVGVRVKVPVPPLAPAAMVMVKSATSA